MLKSFPRRGFLATVRLAAGALRARGILLTGGVQGGRLTVVRGKTPRLRNDGTMRWGKRIMVQNFVHRVDIGTGPDGTLELGDHVRINRGVTIFAADEVTIGSYTRIGNLVTIYDTNFHEAVPGEGVRGGKVRIGRNVWLGHGCFVLPGSTIGDNTVVAAGSVVRKTLPANCVAAGNPARPVRHFEVPPGWIRR